MHHLAPALDALQLGHQVRAREALEAMEMKNLLVSTALVLDPQMPARGIDLICQPDQAVGARRALHALLRESRRQSGGGVETLRQLLVETEHAPQRPRQIVFQTSG